MSLPDSSASHARKHSRIHERNLSAFFPRPGASSSEATGYGDTYSDPHARPSYNAPGESVIPSSGGRPNGLNGFSRETGRSVSGGSADGGASASGERPQRRGHHHKHSMSHNFFSFMDPTATTPNGADLLKARAGGGGPALPSSPALTPLDTFAASSASSNSFLPAPSHSLPRSKYSDLPSLARFLVFCALNLPLTTQAALSLAGAQIVLGAYLWIRGQAGESLAVTGLGYLVVFDGMGTGCRTVLEVAGNGMELVWALMAASSSSAKGERAVRMPFGTHRLVTLAHFSQAIFLLFSAVYVCKESVEHVLLLHGGTEAEGAHGTGHGSMGHGDSGMMSAGSGSAHKEMHAGIILPVFSLALAAGMSVLSAVVLRNHQGLTDAVGPSSLSLARPRPRQIDSSIIDRLGNPFTLTVSVFSAGLVLCSYTIPGVQLAPLDKVLALLQSVAMALIAYPAAKATGQVLLQTAPPGKTAQMTSLQSGLRDISNHPLVVECDKVRIWQLTPQHPQGNGVSEFFIPGSPTQKRRPRSSSISATGQKQDESDRTTLVVTLTVKVRNDASDEDMREVARFTKDRCKAGLKVGGRGGPEGEVTVQVERARRGEEVKYWQDTIHGSPMGKKGAGFALGREYDLIHEHDEDCHHHEEEEEHEHDHAGHAHEEHAGHSHAGHSHAPPTPVHKEEVHHGGHSHAASHAGHSHAH